jgi:elongation factor P
MEFKNATYSWNDGDTYYFMDTTTFDEVQIASIDIDNKPFLGEGMEVKLNIFRDRIVSVELPQSSMYTVVHLGNLM